MAEIAIPINVLNLFAAIIQDNRITIDNEMSEYPPFTVYLAEESCWSNTGVKEISPKSSYMRTIKSCTGEGVTSSVVNSCMPKGGTQKSMTDRKPDQDKGEGVRARNRTAASSTSPLTEVASCLCYPVYVREFPLLREWQ